MMIIQMAYQVLIKTLSLMHHLALTHQQDGPVQHRYNHNIILLAMLASHCVQRNLDKARPIKYLDAEILLLQFLGKQKKKFN